MINHTEFGCIATKRSRCNNLTVYSMGKNTKKKDRQSNKTQNPKTVTTLYYL